MKSILCAIWYNGGRQKISNEDKNCKQAVIVFVTQYLMIITYICQIKGVEINTQICSFLFSGLGDTGAWKVPVSH